MGQNMALVIGPLGTLSSLADGRAADAARSEECVLIQRRARSVIVSVNLDRLTGPAIAAALYELGDMEPTTICLAVGENGITEVLIGFEPAFRRLCEVFASVNLREECSDMPLLPAGIVENVEVRHRSGNKAYLHPKQGQPPEVEQMFGHGPLCKGHDTKGGFRDAHITG